MINVICLKHGTKYSSDYVNRLYRMVKRHLSLPHKFYCFTEDTSEIDADIIIKPLPNNTLKGWWWKPYIFKKGQFDSGDVNLFLDLDTVIIKNIDKFFQFHPGSFCGLRDPGRVWRANYHMLGSAVMRWNNGDFADIWENLEKNIGITTKYHGDQNYIYALHSSSIVFYPDDWIRSYKWEVRSRSELLSDSSNFKEVKNPTPHPETAILAFHGKPMVHVVKDPIIVDNWI
jgi:hypothetical protein